MSVYKMKQITYTAKDVARLHRKYKVNSVGCWVWLGTPDKAGYGNMGLRKDGVSTTFRAHRVSYTMLVGPIPEGLVLDHLCRVRNCVNPDHLEPVTHKENILRGLVGTMGDYADVCKWKHRPEDMGTKGDGTRYCKRCAQARQRAHRLGITTREAIEQEDTLDATMTRKKPHAPNPTKPRKVFVDWTKEQNCVDCNTRLRRRQDTKEQGVLLVAGRGRCGKCLKVVLYGEKYNSTSYHVDNPEKVD